MTYPWPFLSQIHPENGSGENDCFESCLGSLLIAFGKFKPDTPQATILNAISLATRGTPDTPGNPDTNLNQASTGLLHYRMAVTLVTDWIKAIAAPWAIMLVDGTAITKADGTKPYPPSWFNYNVGPDHFILSGPPFEGTFNWFMNPLDPNGRWEKYKLSSVQAAFNCAYTFPSLYGAAANGLEMWTAKRKFSLKALPNHQSTGLALALPGAQGLDWDDRTTVDGEVWGKLQLTSTKGVVGWAPINYVLLPKG